VGENLTRFKNLDFQDFRKLAADESLNIYEKIGFPTSYRQGKERSIFEDILAKLGNLKLTNKTVVDIGPGCSELPRMLIESCRTLGHKLVLIDSPEMLNLLPDEPFVEKVAARFPQECPAFLEAYAGRVDVVLTYSVFHYVFADANVFDFLDRSMALLARGGELLIGDIPNVSKRKRFFASETGIAFHRNFMGTNDNPEVAFNVMEPGEIDDAVITGLMLRARAAGFDAYALPQGEDLPMANRREDLFVKRP
jgi:hypothetical protein